MKVIGITGGIGSGKSIVSCILESLGAIIINADDIGHEALRPTSPLWPEIVDVFGENVLSPTGKIDRRKLGRKVFAAPESLARLNRIVHPWIYETVKAQLMSTSSRGWT